MKNLTREQVNEAVARAGIKIGENTYDILLENMENFSKTAKESDDPCLKNYYHYFALMVSAFHMGIYALKESLYELFCDE